MTTRENGIGVCICCGHGELELITVLIDETGRL